MLSFKSSLPDKQLPTVFYQIGFNFFLKICTKNFVRSNTCLICNFVGANVVLVQQKRQGDVWQNYQHCLLPRLLINTIASLPEKTEPAECSLITSGGTFTSENFTTFQHLGMESLPDDVKRILFRYDCDCVPLFENQLGAYQACENIADMWGIKSSPCSPENQSQLDSASLPVTPAVDPSPSLTPTSSPSLFAGIHKNNSTALFNDNQFDTALLSATHFQTPEPARVFGFTDTPKICNAPKKRLPENSLRDLFD